MCTCSVLQLYVQHFKRCTHKQHERGTELFSITTVEEKAFALWVHIALPVSEVLVQSGSTHIEGTPMGLHRFQ